MVVQQKPRVALLAAPKTTPSVLFGETTSCGGDDIGFQVGYEDPTFFRRLFKRKVGLTPTAYRALRNRVTRPRGAFALFDAWPSASVKSPDDASWMDETGDLTSQMPIKCWLPGREREAEPISDHGETPRGQSEAAAVNSGDSFTVRQVAVNQSSFHRKLSGSRRNFALAKSVEEIPDKYDTLTLPASQTFTNQMFDPPFLRLSNFPTKAA